jgi:hypothetical protein
MRRLHHLLLLGALVAFRASACQCIVPGSVSDAYKHSTIVVSAEALAVSTAPALTKHGPDTISAETQTVRWKVLESWKGPYARGQGFETRTVVQCCLCGRSVIVGSLMLLYLDGAEPYKVSTCGHTAELKETLHEIPELHALREVGANGT